ncbi:hypothetical protein QBC37DRAFT_419589 [Rhypophila decipiens]|uniref:Uncharacterized protein n=1 Tax=Rhypophila decipiens TaxID=261697 RepID=A0AAN6YCB5_9PEZI|nr:hypothetical protein QBC37DRAFT_419589 [Rhypophila decipiens]
MAFSYLSGNPYLCTIFLSAQLGLAALGSNDGMNTLSPVFPRGGMDPGQQNRTDSFRRNPASELEQTSPICLPALEGAFFLIISCHNS